MSFAGISHSLWIMLQEWLRLHGRICISLKLITKMGTSMSLYMRIQGSFLGCFGEEFIMCLQSSHLDGSLALWCIIPLQKQ